MNVIAFDTASPLPAVAVLTAGGEIYEERLPSDRRAAEELLPALERALAAAGERLQDCRRIAVCAGPGSFTGVRIGLASAWGLGRALRAGVEAVSTLEAMAEAARESAGGRVAAALDAGRGEIIAARFALESPRARALAPPSRLDREEARRLAAEESLFCLPADLVPNAKPLPVSPCRALALAVGRAAREDSPLGPRAIYARPPAAEEKRGAP